MGPLISIVDCSIPDCIPFKIGYLNGALLVYLRFTLRYWNVLESPLFFLFRNYNSHWWPEERRVLSNCKISILIWLFAHIHRHFNNKKHNFTRSFNVFVTGYEREFTHRATTTKEMRLNPLKFCGWINLDLQQITIIFERNNKKKLHQCFFLEIVSLI